MADPKTALTDTDEEARLVEFLDHVDGEAEAAKDQVARHWEENIGLVRGDGQWKGTRSPLFLLNLIGNQYERKVAQVSESKPTFAVTSRLGGYTSMAEVLDQTCRAKLEEDEFPLKVEKLARHGMVMGCAFIGSPFDKTIDDVVFPVYDPRQVWLDPSVTDPAEIDSQARYIRIDHVLPCSEIARRYPGRGSLIEPDERYSKYAKKKAQKRGLISSIRGLPRIWRPGGEETIDGPIRRGVLSEYWIRDEDLGSWPGGRHTIRGHSKQGSIILRDDTNEYIDKKFPIDMLEWRPDLDSAYGVDDIQDLKKLQESENRLGDAIMRNALFNSQSWIVADSDALDPQAWKSVTTEGGLIVKKRPLREFRRDPPPALPQYLFQMLQTIPNMADLLTGNADSVKGRTPKGGMEAVVDGLQTAGSPLARMIARRMESLVSRVGKKLIARIIQFYLTDRLLSYYDPSGKLVSYLFERQKLNLMDDGSSIDPQKSNDLYRRFNFVVSPYSSLAMTKMQRAQVGLGLWQSTGGKGFPFKRCLEAADVGDPTVLMAEARVEQEEGLIPMPAPPTKR